MQLPSCDSGAGLACAAAACHIKREEVLSKINEVVTAAKEVWVRRETLTALPREERIVVHLGSLERPVVL